ncbi:MAG: DUF3617 domain-containing protein [Bacteroidales bacterium]|nr:DUF3617 domain-containing protein [Bacteroidales bacterium]
MVKKMFMMAAVFSITLFLGAAFAAGPNMNPGKWEITTQTEMTGMPMSLPPVTHTQCITGDELIPQSQEANNECQVTDIKVSGDTVSWKIVCSGQNGRMEGTGKITYSGDSMDGTMDMVIQGAGMQVKNKLSGKRIGDCD